MQIFEEKGLRIGKLLIDPSREPDDKKLIITHAHSDHVCFNSNTTVISSKETNELIAVRFKEIPHAIPMDFNRKTSFDDFSISLHNSGHVLGGSQVFLEEDGKTVAFTSDFKLQDSLVQKRAEILKAEILVVESTFGLPCFAFPEREQLYNEISAWVKEKVSDNGFVVLAGYSLGKAQELTAIVNKFTGETPLVHESICKNNECYEKLGVKLGSFIQLDHNLNEGNVLIMPPSLMNPHLLQVLEHTVHKKVYTAMATGWGARGNYRKVFPLSDHADFNQLLQYIEQSQPKLVLTTHGYATEFASYVQRRLGIAARPLTEKGQKLLTEFSK